MSAIYKENSANDVTRRGITLLSRGKHLRLKDKNADA